MTTTHNRYVGEKTPRERGFSVIRGLPFIKRNKSGFTLTEIMMVVTIIALLTTVAIPSYIQYRADARARMCISNLRLISHAQEIAAINQGLSTGDICPVVAINTYIDDGAPICPDGGGYTYGIVGINPTCSYGGFHGL